MKILIWAMALTLTLSSGSDQMAEMGRAVGQAVPSGCPHVNLAYSDRYSPSSMPIVTLNNGSGWGYVVRGCTTDGRSAVTMCGRDTLPKANVDWAKVKTRPDVIIREC